MDRKRFAIIGPQNAGKTELSKILASVTAGLAVDVSSYLIRSYCARYDLDPITIISDKDKYRGDLFEYGRQYQAIDPACFVRMALNDGATAVAGIRNVDELQVCRDQQMFDLIIWVNRPGYQPTVLDRLQPSLADVVINNNSTLPQLRLEVESLLSGLGWCS